MSEYTVDKLADEKLELHTKFGRLVCWKVRDDEEYKEFEIDLVTDDGREYQVACIGTNERDYEPFGGFTDKVDETLEKQSRMVHVFAWDGNDEDCTELLYMDPHGDGYYYDAREEA